MRNTAYFALAALALLVACNKTKPAAEAPPPPPTSALDFHTGVVTMAHAAHGCPLLVETTTSEGAKMFIPIGLDEKYHKDGLKLKFTFRPSRASSGACTHGRPAILEDVSVVE